MVYKMKIGNVTIDNNLILGPMAGVTDMPFRMLCREQGCGLVYTEMVSAKAILYNNPNTKELLQTSKYDSPIAVQLFGSSPEIMAEIAARLEEEPFDIIDINMGCPVPKIVGNNEGSSLMRDPKLAGKIISAVVKAVEKPVTVKIRKGFTEKDINAVEIAKIAEEAGAAAIAVHGRTREQYYSGKADWDIIRQVKEAVSIPVIGNGDVQGPEDVEDLVRQTGCDGIMIGRAARGNPWIFKQINQYLTGKQPEKPSLKEVKEMILRHADMLIEFKGEYTGIREMRKHIAWYTTGLPHSSELRRQVNRVETMERLELILDIIG